MKWKLVFSALLAIMLTQCSSSKKTESPKPDSVALVDTYWKLVELNGQPINQPAGVREYHIMLKSADSSVVAFAGCNGLGGKFETVPGNRLKFSNMLSTMMACPELDTENAFKKVLETADSYAISGDMLSLNKAKMAPLARFKAGKK